MSPPHLPQPSYRDARQHRQGPLACTNPTSRERRWLVFDPDGVVTATLRTPEGFAPAAIGEDRIWGVFTDTIEIESVRA
jgi:hypothetical protein